MYLKSLHFILSKSHFSKSWGLDFIPRDWFYRPKMKPNNFFFFFLINAPGNSDAAGGGTWELLLSPESSRLVVNSSEYQSVSNLCQ